MKIKALPFVKPLLLAGTAMLFALTARAELVVDYNFTVNANIPDGVGQYSNTRTLGGFSSYSDVNARINLTSAPGSTMWLGDLYSTLTLGTAAENERVAVLLNRPGRSNAAGKGAGSSLSSLNITLDDAATYNVFHATDHPTELFLESDGRLGISPTGPRVAFNEADRNATLTALNGSALSSNTFTILMADVSQGGQANLAAWGLTITGTAAGSGTLSADGGTMVIRDTSSGDNNTLGAQVVTTQAGGGPLVVNIAGSMTFAGGVSGSSGLTKQGAGTLILGAGNTYAGPTTITSGIVEVSSLTNGGVASSIGNSSNAVSNLVLGGGGASTTAQLTYTGSGDSTDRLFTLGASDANILNASGTGALAFGNSGALAFLGSGNRSLTLGGTNTGENILALLLGDPSGGTFSLLKTDAGTWNVTNQSNTYSGSTSLGNGTLGFADGALGSGPLVFTNPVGTASLRWNTGNVQDLSNRITINDGVTARFNTNGNNLTFASTLGTQAGQTGAIVKSGLGTLTLSAPNVYSGGTTVNGGTLLVNNTTGSGTGTGAVTVNNAGTTLGGTGIISGSVTVNTGANLAPGASTGILQTGALTLESNSNFVLDLNSLVAGTGYDQLRVTGAVSLGGSNILVNAGPGLSLGDTFFVLLNDSSDAISGQFAQVSLVSSEGYIFAVDYFANGDSGMLGNDISLTVTAVPEPGTVLAGLLLLGAVGWSQRRRFLPAKS